MNQRLLIIIAALLLLVGAVGLFMSGKNEQQEQKITVYLAEKNLAEGDIVNEESYSKKVIDVSEESADVSDDMPNAPLGYVVTKDIVQGENITLKNANFQIKEKKETILQAGHFIYDVKVNEKYTSQFALLKKGDLIDVYLKYHRENEQESNNQKIRRDFTFVDKNGKVIKTADTRMVKLLNSRRLFLIKKGKLSSFGNEKTEEEGQIQVVSTIMAGIELNSDDVKHLYSVENLGELIIFPANQTPGKEKMHPLFPSPVREIRGYGR